MVLLNANPLDDISNTQKIDSVIKAGSIVDRSRLNLPVNR
jgi:imidazolonepropionase-like amidohydrolase